MKFAVTSFGWNFSQFFSRMDGKDDVFEWQLVIAKWHCLLLASSTAVARPARRTARRRPGCPARLTAGARCNAVRCPLPSMFIFRGAATDSPRQDYNHQTLLRVPMSTCLPSAMSFDLTNKTESASSARARWPAPPDDDSGHFLTLINNQTLAYKIKINC